SLKRGKAVKNDGESPRMSRLKKVEPEANRYLLARVPLAAEDGTSTLLDEDHFTASLFPAQLECADPPFQNALLEALAADSYFRRFVQRDLDHEDGDLTDRLGIPGKDNGLDIEGLAFGGTTATGAARLFVGLRGPVLRGWAAILELHVI